MSWLFSQALVEEYLEEHCSDGEQSVPLNGNRTQLAYLPPDKMMDFSRLSRFGMTFKPLTESRGADLLTWYLAGFHARTFPAQEKEQELPESEADCGKNLPALLAKYDPDSCLWKTAQCSLFEDSELSLETFPRWGLMRNGALYLRETAVPHMKGSESGLWLTPRASDTGAGEKQETFLARMGDRTDRCAQSLAAQVNNPKTWPTPTAHNAKEAAYPAEFLRKTPTLAATVAMRKFPTPQASDNRDRGNLGSPATLRRKEKGKQISLGQSVSDVSGALNPPWVEWLMGFPLGWTDLKPLETARFQSWRQQHSESYQEQQSND